MCHTYFSDIVTLFFVDLLGFSISCISSALGSDSDPLDSSLDSEEGSAHRESGFFNLEEVFCDVDLEGSIMDSPLFEYSSLESSLSVIVSLLSASFMVVDAMR